MYKSHDWICGPGSHMCIVFIKVLIYTSFQKFGVIQFSFLREIYQ